MNEHPYMVRDPRSPSSPPRMAFFREEAQANPKASQEAGTALFDNVVIAEVLVPGQSKSTVLYEMLRTRPDGSEKLSAEAKGPFAEAFGQWREKQTPAMTGTPLSEVAWMDRAVVETFRHNKVFTVQQLAELSDQAIGGIPRGRFWRDKAKSQIEEASGGAQVQRLTDENSELKERLASLEQSFRDLQAKAQTPGFDAPKGKPGRKPKTQSAEESETA